MSRLRTLGIALLCLAVPASADAQDQDPVDPEQGSPSGYVYEIPLEGARRDAAPTRSRSGTEIGQGESAGRAAITSGTGYGSSPVVPGASTSQAARPARGAERAGREKDDGEAAAGATQGGGGAPPASGIGPATDDLDALRTSKLIATSGSAVTPLIVIVLAAVVGLALAAVARQRRST